MVRFVKKKATPTTLPFDDLKDAVQLLFKFPRKTISASLREQGILRAGTALPSLIPAAGRPGDLVESQLLLLAEWIRKNKPCV